MDNEERRRQLNEHQAAIKRHSVAINDLKESCAHDLPPLTPKQLADKWMTVSACCTICRKDFGWRCKESPDGVCHYFTKDSKVTLIDGRVVDPPAAHDSEDETLDNCMFCGHLEERK